MTGLAIGKAVGALLAAVLAVVVIGYIGNALIPPGGDRVATAARDGGEAGGEVVAEEPAEAEEPAAEEMAAAAVAPGIDLATADVAAGKKLFRKCSICHTVGAGGRNRVGPNLFAIVGRAVGGHAGFRYSGAMASLGGTWTVAMLDDFLTKPRDFLDGTKMRFAGLGEARDRANLIAYLATLAD